MLKLSKRRQLSKEKIQFSKVYSLAEGLKLVKTCATAKFRESVDVAIKLGVDPRKLGKTVLGAVVLPYGIGRNVKIAVFADQEGSNKAKNAGADFVGIDGLIKRIRSGNIDFDLVIATPETMQTVGKLGKILGPRGLMPSLTDGTVAVDVEAAVKNAKHGQARYRADKKGIIHCSIGKVDFSEEALKENLLTLLSDIRTKSIPRTTEKEVPIKKLTLSSTMGPGITVAYPID
nr:50S ribosomal protein L1 [Coxiella endosymbiont of Amblyomma sculptum]